MKSLFQRRASGTESGPARLTLGAFGKHPGWDDHILGIGVETETLAHLKQILYVQGIGSQIDSGAWEKLESEKRLPGFDHTFLGLSPGHVLLGQLWSSTDGKGRAKYPMVLAIDGEGVSPGFVVNVLSPGLENLRAACKATNAAEQVAQQCRSAQEQLRSLLARENARVSDPGPGVDARQRFLANSQLGPDRLGFLRALHELKAAPGASREANALASLHLRVPLGVETTQEALQLWAALLRCIVPEPTPLFLLARAGEPWLDVLINDPAPDDFFCLQAAPRALPLTTEIPYGLAPDLSERWSHIEAKFTGGIPRTPRPAQSPLPPPPPVPPPSASVRPSPGPPPPPTHPVPPPPQAARPSRPPPAVPTPAPSAPQRPTAPAPPATTPAPARRSPLPWLALGLLILVVAGAVFWLLSRHPDGSPASFGQKSRPNGASAAAQQEHDFQIALAGAQAAQATKDYSNALAQAELALKLKPNDTNAAELVATLKPLAQAAAVARQKYQTATNAATLALVQMNYQEATNQAAIALALQPDDPTASKLLADAQQGLAAGAQQQKFQVTFDAAKSAFEAGQFETAAAQAAAALTLRPNDPAAAKLSADARTALKAEAMVTQKLQQYQAATNAAALALGQTNFPEAARQAQVALSLQPNDPAARQLKAQAAAAADLASAQAAFSRGDYSTAQALAKDHPGLSQFTNLLAAIAAEQTTLANDSLSLSNGDYTFIQSLTSSSYAGKPSFSNLLAQATTEKTTLDTLQQLKQTNGWQQLKQRLADPALAGVLAKPPFADLRTWADAQSTAAASGATPDLQRLDTDLEVLLVQFGVLKATAAEIHFDAARQTKPLPSGALDDPQPYLNRVQRLEQGYKNGGWLDQDNRQKYLTKIREAINYR
ncbi:MAG TPA: hypothetical protein VG167_11860 [Verrucomicrobiae bacterium]|nr:hypothetical protein [Verrucomicrobiae bacterium]